MMNTIKESKPKVSNCEMQSGNQVDYPQAEVHMNSGPLDWPELERASTASSANLYIDVSPLRPAPIRKAIRRLRRHNKTNVDSGRRTLAQQSSEGEARPGAPHNTSQYLAQDFGEKSVCPTETGFKFGSMIGLISADELIETEQRPAGKEAAFVADEADKSTSDSYTFNREPTMNSEFSAGSKDTVGMLLHEIKVRDRRIEQLETLLQNNDRLSIDS